MRGGFGHADQVFEVLIPLPLLFVERRHLAGAAFLDQFRHSGSQSEAEGRSSEDLFRRRQGGEQFQNIGGAVKASLAAGVQFPEAELQDFGERCCSRARI